MREAALAGVKVADFSWVLAGPTVGRALADHGATVVRVESARRVDLARALSPFTDGESRPDNSALASDLNAGKLGLALDLAIPEAREVARKLCDWADIVLESFSPGTMKAWGLDYDSLRRSNPGLIMLSTTLMGNFGPLSKLAGFGSAGSCLSGIHNVTGWPDMVPTGYCGPYTDFVAPKFSLIGLLAALDRRARTGEGAYIDLSQVEAGLQYMALEILEYSTSGSVASRQGNADPALCPNEVYACAARDQRERYVAISIRTQADWKALIDVLALSGIDDLIDVGLEARKAHRERIDAAIARAVADEPAERLEERLQKAGIPAYVALHGSELPRDPQLRERNHFIAVEHPRRGPTYVESTRIQLSQTPARPRGAGPDIGEHQTMVLQEILEIPEDVIRSYRQAGAFF